MQYPSAHAVLLAFCYVAAVSAASNEFHRAQLHPLIALDPFATFQPLPNTTLFERQEQQCVNPGYEPCPAEGCCPPDLVCQPRGCCEPGATECPTTEYCYVPGYACCLDSGGGSCPVGTTCCNQACCDPGELCCDGWCCPSGSECGASLDECLSMSTSISTSISTSTSSRAMPTELPSIDFSVDFSSLFSSISGILSDFTIPSVSIPTLSPAFSPGPASVSPGITPAPSVTPTLGPIPTYSTPPSTCSYPSLAGRQNDDCNLPVFNYPFVESLTDDTCRSMCLGMGGANQVIYTYGGKNFGDGNRTKKCKGCCTNVLKSSGEYAGDKTECDEQPPASVEEGGNSAHIACIIAEQNQIHGRLLRAFYDQNKLNAGDRFINRVDGLDCSTVLESDLQPCRNGNSGGKMLLTRQSDMSGTVNTVHSVNTTMGDFKLMTVGLGDLEAGSYFTSIQLPAESAVEDIVVIDGSGFQYGQGSLDAAKSQNGDTIQFTLPNFIPGVALVARTTQDQDAMRYSFAPSPTGSSGAASSYHGSKGGVLTGSISFMVSLFALW